MKQKWAINIYRGRQLIAQYKMLGSFKAAKEYAEVLTKSKPGATYRIIELETPAVKLNN